ncbi:hypothetical protein BH09MYX1_BH09MYX1_48250 [soil metagenome]
MSCEEAFDLTHDYKRRLEWDTLLSAAYLEDGALVAARGAKATCVGRGWLSRFALTTVYVSFARPNVAAVKMVNRPPLFSTWAASIRHEPLGEGASTLTYTFNFTARPSWLAWLIEPVMAWFFARETKARLAAMREYFARAREER